MNRWGERIFAFIYQEKIVLSLSSILGFILFWHVLTDVLGLFPPLFLPSPEKVFFTIYEKITVPVGEEKLFGHVGISLVRILVGVGIALALAVPLGILMGWYEDLDSVASPLIEVLRPIPPIAWIPAGDPLVRDRAGFQSFHHRHRGLFPGGDQHLYRRQVCRCPPYQSGENPGGRG